MEKVCPEPQAELFERLAASCYHRLYRAAWFFTRNHEDAQDIVQETCMRAFTAFPGFKGNAAFYTWIYTIFRNVMKKSARRKKIYVSRFGAIEEGKEPGAPRSTVFSANAHAERVELSIAVQDALLSLPDKYREILVLRHFEDFSYSEIAAILKCSTGTVKSRIFKARELLRKKLR